MDEIKTTPDVHIACLQRLHNGMVEAMFSDYDCRSIGATNTLVGPCYQACCGFSTLGHKSRCNLHLDLHQSDAR